MNTKKALDNGWLTQVELEDESQRNFVKEISSYGSLDNWRDATNDEKEEWEKEHPVEPIEGVE